MTHIGEQEKKKKFEQFFILTFPKVKAFAWKILRSEEDAEDIAQDIFVKLWDNPEIWENKETWDSYIYTMARNQIYNFLNLVIKRSCHKKILLLLNLIYTISFMQRNCNF